MKRNHRWESIINSSPSSAATHHDIIESEGLTVSGVYPNYCVYENHQEDALLEKLKDQAEIRNYKTMDEDRGDF